MLIGQSNWRGGDRREVPASRARGSAYHDPEYAPLIRLRQTGANAEVMLVDGV